MKEAPEAGRFTSIAFVNPASEMETGFFVVSIMNQGK
jgi:hypothetical protein